jgi:Ca-activated chloride channel family protein
MSSDLSHSDDPLDRQLREVPVPPGLRARLTTDIWADDEIDRRLNDVAIPFGLKYRMREIASPPHWRSRSLVAAAALFLVVSCWQIGSLMREFFATPRAAPFAWQPLDSWMNRPEAPRIELASGSDPVLHYRPFVLSPVETRNWLPDRTLAEAVARQRRELSATLARVSARPLRGPDPYEMIAAATRNASVDGVRGAPPLPVDLGKHDLSDRPGLSWRMPRGVDPALGAEERRFLLETGSFPFVQPRDFPTSAVPLVVQTTAFEVARQALAQGETPPADRMRAEEFLAAADYRFGAPAGDTPLRLLAYGGIAPWSPVPPSPAATNGAGGQAATPAGARVTSGGPTTGGPAAGGPASGPATGRTPNEPTVPPEQVGRLLQLGVRARDLRDTKRPATYLTIGVDVSEGMRFAGRLDMVKRALRAVVGRMQGADRITLIALGGANPTIIEEASRAELDQLLAAIDWLTPVPDADAAYYGSSLARGVITACRVAARRGGAANIERRVIVFTDSAGEFDPRGVREASQLLASTGMKDDRPQSRIDVRLDLVDVTGDNEETAWEDVVRIRGGRVLRADSAERMRSILIEELTGQNQRLASDVVLSVTFNPQAVVGYRLIGHEPTALAAVAPPKTAVDFHAGQSGSTLFEVRLNGGRDTTVATVVLRWRDPVDGTPHEMAQVITRGMLGTPWEKASSSLQMAAIATATAARLRNSPWGDHVAPGEALDWARRLDRARKGHDLEPWLTMLDQIQKLPPRRGSSRNGR